MSDTSAEMACSLDDEAFSDRRALFRERLLPQALRISRIGNGLQIIFAQDPVLRSEIQAFIALERQCCGFLDFELEEDRGRLRLIVTGPLEAQAALRQLESAFADGDDGQTNAATDVSNALLKRTGLASAATGVVCLLVCELPVLLTVIGLGGVGAWLAYFQPGPAIEAGASALMFAGSTAYVVWWRRTRQTRAST